MIKFTVITLFPEALTPYLETSMMWKATEKGLAQFDLVNLRDYGLGPHKSVDDTPYGGGDGMLLRCEPAFAAIEDAKAKDPNLKVILPTPVGQTWNQELAREFASGKILTESSEEAPLENVENPSTTALHYLILCPHYEGYDERILSLVDFPLSLGNFILTGGELPALIFIDSITRLIPGVLGGPTSALVESFSEGNTLEYPQYTKPAVFRGQTVPEVLLSGNHQAIADWRREHSRRHE